jgi:hypothetical protein
VAESKGLIRARDLADHGIPRQYLSIACERGLLERLDRGLYALPGAVQTEHPPQSGGGLQTRPPWSDLPAFGASVSVPGTYKGSHFQENGRGPGLMVNLRGGGTKTL